MNFAAEKWLRIRLIYWAIHRASWTWLIFCLSRKRCRRIRKRCLRIILTLTEWWKQNYHMAATRSSRIKARMIEEAGCCRIWTKNPMNRRLEILAHWKLLASMNWHGMTAATTVGSPCMTTFTTARNSLKFIQADWTLFWNMQEGMLPSLSLGLDTPTTRISFFKITWSVNYLWRKDYSVKLMVLKLSNCDIIKTNEKHLYFHVKIHTAKRASKTLFFFSLLL